LDLATKALISNKEDTALAIEIIGDITEENNKIKSENDNLKKLNEEFKEVVLDYEQKQKRANAAVNIIIPATTVPMIVSGAILMATNNDYGDMVLYTGLALFGGCEIIWNGGRFIFHIW
jgi:hypothetical protein